MSGENIATTPWWEQYRTDVAGCNTHRIDVFFRSLAPTQGGHDARRQVLGRLDEMTDLHVLDSYDISILGDGICLCEECGETRLARRVIETLSALREGGGEQIEPLGFTERSVDSSLTGEQYALLVPPEVSLAVYVEDSLRAVLPARIDGVEVSVGDYLDAATALEMGRTLSRAEA